MISLSSLFVNELRFKSKNYWLYICIGCKSIVHKETFRLCVTGSSSSSCWCKDSDESSCCSMFV